MGGCAGAGAARAGDDAHCGPLRPLRELRIGDEVFAPVGEVGVVITGPGPDLVIDGADITTPHPDLYVEDRTVCISRYGASVTAGCGATLVVDQDVTCEAEAGATVYLAPGAHLQDTPTGALERAEITVVTVASLLAGRAQATRTTVADVTHSTKG